MRTLALVVALLLASCTTRPPALPGPTPTPEPGFLDVTALLDLSGSRAPRGDPQRNALQLWLDLDRARGGGQVRVRLKVVDVAGSEARTLIELRRAAVEDRADAVIVGVPVSLTSGTFVDAVRVAALPVLLTLPAPEPVALTGGGRWTFAVAATPEQIARRTVAASARTVIFVREERALDPEVAAILREHERLSLDRPTVVQVGRQQDAVALVRFVANASRVHLIGPPRDWAALAPALRSGARAPTYVLSWLCDPADLGDLRELDAVWPGPASLAPGPGAPRRDAIRAYTDRHGPPTAAAASAYDALSALVLAAERVGVDDRERLREGLELVAFTGAASTYAFSVTRHAGYAADDLVLYRWRAGEVVPDVRR